MTPFTISRLHTASGIFRLSGRYEPHRDGWRFEYHHVAIMGTDGWVMLTLDHPSTRSSLAAIEPALQAHLASSR